MILLNYRFPDEFSFQNVSKNDFDKDRNEDEIRLIFQSLLGVNLNESEFELIKQNAIQNHGKLNIESFRDALNERQQELAQ